MCMHLGKIDLSSAEDQWNSTLINKPTPYGSNTNNSNNNSNNNNTSNDGNKEDISYTTDITLLAHGNIRVETMSWIQVIRNKYGFKDTSITNTNVKDHNSNILIKPGRTASASLIAAELNKKNI